MARHASVAFPLAIAVAVAHTVAASAQGQGGAPDDLRLLPRDTIALVRIASIDQVERDFSDLIRTALESMLEHVPAEYREQAEQEMRESANEMMPNFDDLKIGDTSRPIYAGILLPPRDDPSADNEAVFDLDAMLGIAVLRSDDPEAVVGKINAREREEYEKELKKYEQLKRVQGFGSDMPQMKELREPQPVRYIAHEGWVLCTNDERCLEVLRQTVQDRGNSLADVIDPAAREVLMAGDIAVAANAAVILEQKEVQEYLGQTKARWNSYVSMIRLAGVDWDQWNIDPHQIEAYVRRLIEAAFETAVEPRWLAAHIEVTAEAVGGTGLVTVAAGGHIDKFNRAQPPLPFDLLDELPAGRPAYLAFRADHGLLRYLLTLFEPLAVTVKDKRQLRSYRRLLEGKPSETAIVFDRPLRGDWGIRTLSVTRAENPAAFIDYERSNHEGIYEQALETFRDKPVDVKVEERDDVEADPDNFNQVLELFGVALGGTYRETWMFARGNRFLSAAGYSWEHAEREFEALLGDQEGTAGHGGFREARRHLGERANVVAMVNLGDVFLFILVTSRSA